MRAITKTDEGTTAWVKSTICSSAVQKLKIIQVWEDADSYEFKYSNWDKSIADKDGFSRSTYRGVISHGKIAETIARYDQPLNFWRELKVSAIRLVHLVMERLEFNFKD